MYEVYFRNFNQKVPLTTEEEEFIKSRLSLKKLRKRQYLLQEGDVCKTLAFVERGTLRAYSVDEGGQEHIIQFAPENWFVSDLYSFLSGDPAIYNIDAIEDSELVLISRSAHDELLEKMPKFETFTRLNITNAYLAMQRRINSTISASPEERYEQFMSLYPQVARRVPQHMIASYMGLKPETLSRIRKRIASAR